MTAAAKLHAKTGAFCTFQKESKTGLWLYTTRKFGLLEPNSAKSGQKRS
jgi:hypothetical protein